MIINKLTYKELEALFLPILKIECVDRIKENNSKIFHAYSYNGGKEIPAKINTETNYIKTTYCNFEIEIITSTYLNETHDIIISFKKNWTFFDFFNSPTKKLKNIINKFCEKQIHDFYLFDIDPQVRELDNGVQKFFYQSGALNQNYKKSLISPFLIYYRNDYSHYNCMLEFQIYSRCYERINDKTYLRKDWKEIFSMNTAMFDYIRSTRIEGKLYKKR